MSLIPDNDKQRKSLPLWRQVVRYFPKALREITKVSVVNNVRYNPDRDPTDINWARGKSTDQMGSAFRHMLERDVDGKVFEEVAKEIAEKTGFDRTYVLAAAAWRLLAALELEIEAEEVKEVPDAQISTDPYVKVNYPEYYPELPPSVYNNNPCFLPTDCGCAYCTELRKGP